MRSFYLRIPKWQYTLFNQSSQTELYPINSMSVPLLIITFKNAWPKAKPWLVPGLIRKYYHFSNVLMKGLYTCKPTPIATKYSATKTSIEDLKITDIQIRLFVMANKCVDTSPIVFAKTQQNLTSPNQLLSTRT